MDQQVMKEMVLSGVRIFRLNFSHADAAYFGPVIQKIREVEKETGIRLTVMGDLCGPKIRIGEVKGSPLQIRKGAHVCLGVPEMASGSESDIFISLGVPELLEGLAEDMPVSLSDGMLQFRVVKVIEPDRLVMMEALNGGILTSNKGIAFPGKTLKVAAMTDKDRRDLHQGIDIGIDAVALSFVQSKDDIEDIKTEIARHGTWIPVVAKVERKNAVEKLDSILEVADAIMVARGDLGLECSPAELPIIQKKILRACRHAQKPAIVATQMLLSMVKNPIPTRAESTDVANAMLDGTDCVMLSEETAIGSYPAEAVRFINEIAQYAEPYYLERIGGPFVPKAEKNPPKFIAYSACLMADNADSAAIVCHSTTGATARYISSRRPAQPIYAMTTDSRILRWMNFFWSINPVESPLEPRSHQKRAEKFVQEFKGFKPGENVIIASGQATPGMGTVMTNEIKVYYK
jgi:pyruvate kinase